VQESSCSPEVQESSCSPLEMIIDDWVVDRAAHNRLLVFEIGSVAKVLVSGLGKHFSSQIAGEDVKSPWSSLEIIYRLSSWWPTKSCSVLFSNRYCLNSL
jgi:hypothetical protein